MTRMPKHFLAGRPSLKAVVMAYPEHGGQLGTGFRAVVTGHHPEGVNITVRRLIDGAEIEMPWRQCTKAKI